jgi:hypothetical protein
MVTLELKLISSRAQSQKLCYTNLYINTQKIEKYLILGLF